LNDPSKKYVFVSFLVLFILNSLFINAQNRSGQDDYISLGLLVNNQNEIEAVCAARLAIDEVNENGGIKGKPLKLIIRSVEGSWGAGSSEVVDLVFKEKVVAILGSIDGRNSHLAEQVIAKTQLTYLSIWATDPSLSKAYIPWYFSAVPTDDQQAELFLNEIGVKKRRQHVLVVHDQSYDAQQALKSLYKASNEIEDLMISSVASQSWEPKNLLSGIENNNLDAIILLGRQIPFSSIANQIKVSGKSIPVYANLSAQSSEDYTGREYKNMDQSSSITTTSGLRYGVTGFQKAFLQNCNSKPGPVAAYAYDGIMIISEALKQSGNDPGRLQKSMSQINYQGVTGTVQFDSQGRLKNIGELLLIKE